MQASPDWEIAAGYVGAMRAEIPFTSLYSQAVSLTLDETLITIRPRSRTLAKAAQGASGGNSAYNPGRNVSFPHPERCSVMAAPVKLLCCLQRSALSL